jgi:hypothetical protein
VIASLVATPGLIVCETDVLLKPVAMTAIVLLPDDCKRVEAEGVKVILPGDTEYALEAKVVPPTVMLVTALRQSELSLKVTSNAPSAVALPAAIKVGGGPIGMLKVEEVAEVRDPEVNVIVAPVTATGLVAVSPENVVTPEEAPTEVVPPIVHVPAPTAAVMEAVLVVTVLPY